MKKLLSILCIGALALPGLAFAGDGTLGATSTGTVGVSLSILEAPDPEVKISGLSDLVFGDIDLAVVDLGTLPSPVEASGICVFMNTAGTYSMHIASANPTANGAAYLKKLGQSGLYRYTWSFKDAEGNENFSEDDTSLGGVTATGFVPSNTVGCSDGTTASLTLAPTGWAGTDTHSRTYTDTLTLTVSPE